jgi:hypothetical protein
MFEIESAVNAVKGSGYNAHETAVWCNGYNSALNAILSGTLPECQYEDRTSCTESAPQYIREQAVTSHTSAMLQGLKPHAGNTRTSA